MNTFHKVTLLAAAGASLLGGAFAVSQSESETLAVPPAVVERPLEGQLRVVHAQPFVLDESYVHTWWHRDSAPLVRSGWLLVIEAETDLLYPRQTHNPILFGGAMTAERVNSGDTSGRLVAVLPAPVDETGTPLRPLADVPLWFAWDENVAEDDRFLPEEVERGLARAELEQARAAGIAPRPRAELERALAAGGGTLYVRDRVDLDLILADLVELHSPSERELYQSLRVPVIGR